MRVYLLNIRKMPKHSQNSFPFMNCIRFLNQESKPGLPDLEIRAQFTTVFRKSMSTLSEVDLNQKNQTYF